IILPSLPLKPTTVDAATTLCTQIIFPAPAPITCNARIIGTLIPVACAISYCTGEKVNVDTVALPLTKAPNAPQNGAINNLTRPNELASDCEIYCGIPIRSAPLIPLFVNTCTSVNVAKSASAASLIDSTDSFAAFIKLEKDLRSRITAILAAKIKIVPGEYKISQSEVTPSTPSILCQVKSMADVVNSSTTGTILVNKSNPTTTI